MIEEIIYTSAAKGLRSGSHGFCTVISTAGMAANMAERLESMSGYRHAFPLNHPNNSQNPVNYVHVTTRLAGEKRHIISRIADAGQDYSGRTNKLAHHVALENIQHLTAGPARLLNSGLLVDGWDGKVETRSPRVINNPDVPARIQLTAWQAATGDGGWAGVVAERLLASKAPVSVIFKPGTDTLALVVEVLDLIPIPKRWEITFSTYFTRLLAGTECQLRFYLHGTSEATTIRNDARATIIDLAATLPPAEGGPLVEKARGGVIEYTASAVRKVPAGGLRRSHGRSVSDEELDEFLSDDDHSELADDFDASEAYIFEPPGNARLEGTFRQRNSGMPFPVIASIAVVLVAAIGVLAFVLSRPANTKVPDAAGESPLTFEPVAEVEDRSPNREPPSTENVDTNAGQPKQPDPVPVNPFNDKRPFDKLRQLLADSLENAVWQLPSAAKQPKSEAWDVYVSSVDSVSVISESDGVLVTPSIQKTEATWHLTVEGVQLGWFLLDAGIDNAPAVLQWHWSSGIAESQDIFSDSARALRVLRDSRLSFQATQQTNPFLQPADSLLLTIAGDNWPRFVHLGSGTDNLGVTLQIPSPGSMNDNGDLQRDSQTIFLEADAADAVSLAVVSECNALIAGHDAFLAKSVTSDKTTSVWDLGLTPKGSLLKDGETFGRYTVSKNPTAGIVSLSFEWMPNVDSEFAAPLQWIPVELTIAGQRHTLFPRGPQQYAIQELLDLGQGDQCVFPTQNTSELPLKFPSDTVAVNFEIAIRSQTAVVNSQLKVTRENPSPTKDIAFFPLETPVRLSEGAPPVSATLGEARLTATPVKTAAGVIPAAIELKSVCSFNRSNLFHLNSLQAVNVFDPRYWNSESQFRQQAFVTSATEMLQQIGQFSSVLAADLRHESRLARYARQKDPFQRIEKHLRDSITELDRLLISTDDEIRLAYPRVFTKALGQRNTPTVKQLLQRQRDELEKVRMMYSGEQWKADADTIASIQEELAQLAAEVNISLDLQRQNGKPLRLYFVSTSVKGGAK